MNTEPRDRREPLAEIGEALAIAERNSMHGCDALRELVWTRPTVRSAATAMLPEDVQRILVLDALIAHVATDGLAGFFESRELGAFGAEAAAWCDDINATRAARYMREGLRLFPESTPSRDDDIRIQQVDTITRGIDLFAPLDREYRGVEREIADCLVARVRADAPALARLLASL